MIGTRERQTAAGIVLPVVLGLPVDRGGPAGVVGEIDGCPQTRKHVVYDVRLEHPKRVLFSDLAAEVVVIGFEQPDPRVELEYPIADRL